MTPTTPDVLARYRSASFDVDAHDHDGATVIRSFRDATATPTEYKVLDAQGGAVRQIISTNGIDRANDRMNTRGGKLERFQKNNVVLWCHRSDMMPVANGYDLAAQNDRLESTTVFHMETDLSRDAYKLVSRGLLPSTSIGFIPLTWKDEDARTFGDAYEFIPTVRTYETWELLEYSICPIPMNPGVDTVRQAMSEEFEATIRRAVSEGVIEADSMLIKTLPSGNRIEAGVTNSGTEDIATDDPLAFYWHSADRKAYSLKDYTERHGAPTKSTIRRYYRAAETDLTAVVDTEAGLLHLETAPDTRGKILVRVGADMPAGTVIVLEHPGFIEKAGAVLNSKNKANLREAKARIDEVLASAGETEPEEESKSKSLDTTEAIVEPTSETTEPDTTPDEIELSDADLLARIDVLTASESTADVQTSDTTADTTEIEYTADDLAARVEAITTNP